MFRLAVYPVLLEAVGLGATPVDEPRAADPKLTAPPPPRSISASPYLDVDRPPAYFTTMGGPVFATAALHGGGTFDWGPQIHISSSVRRPSSEL